MDPKNITKTSFCNREIDNVTDNAMKKYILNNLNLKTGIRFERTNFSIRVSVQYKICKNL